MVWPDPADPGRSADAPLSSGAAPRQQRDNKIPPEYIADLLARGGWDAPTSVTALASRLTHIAEQACLAIPATGSAIALKSGPEFICRASYGANAPPPETRLRAESGLSGTCVREKAAQRCDDAETDPRVDPVASRQLGVRSLLVLPLMRGEELLGIFEVFSPHPHAFSARDLETLKSLGGRVVEELTPPAKAPAAAPSRETGAIAPTIPAAAPVRPAAQEPKPLPHAPAKPPAAAARPPVSPAPLPAPAKQEPPKPTATKTETAKTATAAAPIPAPQPPPPNLPSPPEASWVSPVLAPKPQPERPRDRTTGILILAVIALAVLLGWMIGHFGWQHESDSKAAEGAPAATSHSGGQPQASSTVAAKPSAADGAPISSAPPPSSAPQKTETPKPSAAPPASPAAKRGSTADSGGLTVYQEGKVIFEQKSSPAGESANPQATGTASLSPVLSSEMAGAYLIQRVEPIYPEAARKQHIQGSVVLEVWVGKDGLVEKLRPVSGNSALLDAAVDAVRQWRFRPYAPQGHAVAFSTHLGVNFVLQDKP